MAEFHQKSGVNFINNDGFASVSGDNWLKLGEGNVQIDGSYRDIAEQYRRYSDFSNLIYDPPTPHCTPHSVAPGRGPDNSRALSGQRFFRYMNNNCDVDQFRVPDTDESPIRWNITTETALPEDEYNRLIYGNDFGVIRDVEKPKPRYDDHGVEI